MPVTSSCPTCRRELQIPDDLLGRSVKCAECGTTFRAGEGTEVPVVAANRYDPGFAPPPWDEKVAAARRRARGPALALGVVAVLNLLAGLFITMGGNYARSLPDAQIEDFHKQFLEDHQRQNPRQPLPPEVQNLDNFKPLFRMISNGIFYYGIIACAVAVLTLISALRAMRLTGLGLAKFAAILTMIPFTSPLWMLGIIVGIWALISLNRPENP